jgi:hypothetical protein
MKAQAMATDDVPKAESEIMSAKNTDPWWRNTAVITKAAAIVTTTVTALLGGGAVGTNYFVEKVKLRAQTESLDAKRISDSEDRKDKNAAAERELRTKYVDLALQPALDIDHRARIFGYLATVLENPAQRNWATREAEEAGRQRAYLLRLRTQLDQAVANSSTSTKRYLEELTGGKLSEVALTVLKTQHENELEQISILQRRIRALEDGSASPGLQTTGVATGTAKP